MKTVFEEYGDLVKKVTVSRFNGVDVTHDGFPLSAKESKFINLFIENGNLGKCLKTAGLREADISGKDYILDEIQYRLGQIKDETIADANEILRYFTAVMRGEIKDQFGLDAPLVERTSAAKELAKRIVDAEQGVGEVPEIKVTLNWEGM